MPEVARALDTPIIADEMVQSTVEAMTIAKRRAFTGGPIAHSCRPVSECGTIHPVARPGLPGVSPIEEL